MKIFWGILIGLVTWVMITTAGVNGVKMLSNLGGGPALILELLICVSLIQVAINPRKYDFYQQDYLEDGTPIRSVSKKAIMSESAVKEYVEENLTVPEENQHKTD
jgi:choline-glycine betaine transporter